MRVNSDNISATEGSGSASQIDQKDNAESQEVDSK